jgi:hypothetical protein
MGQSEIPRDIPGLFEDDAVRHEQRIDIPCHASDGRPLAAERPRLLR